MIRLTLDRKWLFKNATFGELRFGTNKLCTLEDPKREPGVKIYGDTCIPDGVYKITFYDSPTFGRVLPMLLDVPQFTYILIHSGNTTKDTKGCILVGTTMWLADRKISGGKTAGGLDRLLAWFEENKGEEFEIEIKTAATVVDQREVV